MEYIKDAVHVARATMKTVAPVHETEFATVVAFLSDNPDMSRTLPGRGQPPVGSAAYIARMAERYAAARRPRYPTEPATVPDPAVSLVLEAHYGIDPDELERIRREHQLSMAAENIVGDLLERYIAANITRSGWTWCAGEMVKAVDFVRRRGDGLWDSLQVKNRDNSENSSSSAIRKGTPIQKWYRTKSRTGRTMWNEFPATEGGALDEGGFDEFVRGYFSAPLIVEYDGVARD